MIVRGHPNSAEFCKSAVLQSITRAHIHIKGAVAPHCTDTSLAQSVVEWRNDRGCRELVNGVGLAWCAGETTAPAVALNACWKLSVDGYLNSAKTAEGAEIAVHGHGSVEMENGGAELEEVVRGPAAGVDGNVGWLEVVPKKSVLDVR